MANEAKCHKKRVLSLKERIARVERLPLDVRGQSEVQNNQIYT